MPAISVSWAPKCSLNNNGRRSSCIEENLENLDEIIEKLESGELSLDDAIKEYENAMKLIKTASKMLNEAEGRLIKVIEKNGEIETEEI